MATFDIKNIQKHDYLARLLNDIKNGKEICIENSDKTKKYVKIKYNEKYLQLFDFKNLEKLLKSGNKYVPFFDGYKITDISKQPYSGQGSKSSNANGKKLADAGERATILAINLYKNGKKISSPKDTNEELFINDLNAFDKWKNTFDVTPKIVQKIIPDFKKYEFIHDSSSNTPIKSTIEKIAKVARVKKDSWNPADCWAILKSELNNVIKELNNVADLKDIHLINAKLKELYNQKKIYPLSFKQITSENGQIEYANIDNESEFLNVTFEKVPCNFDFDDKKQNFKTQDIGQFSFKTNDGKIVFQIKGFPFGYGTSQIEINSDGSKTGGRLGKVSTKIVDEIMNDYGFSRISSIKELKDFKWSKNDFQEYSKYYYDITKSKLFKENIENWCKLAQNNNDLKARLCHKIQGLRFSWFLWKNQKDISEIITRLVLGAKKISKNAGLFIKIF